MNKKPALKLVHGTAAPQPQRHTSELAPKCPPKIVESGQRLLDRLLTEGVMEGDSLGE